MPQNTTANQYYEAEAILDERMIGEKKSYLIKWKGSDQNGKPWDPTWEPESHCTQPLIASWEKRNPAKRKLKSPLPSNNPLKNSPPIKRERKHQKISAGFNYGTPSANIGSSPTVAVKNVKIQRHLLRPFHILLPVPLTKLQQIFYRRTFDKPQLFKYLAETNLANPPELNSIIFQTKDNLLKIVNHLSLLLSSVPGISQGMNVSYQPFEKMGKLVMMYHLLNGLRNCDLTLGIAIPQGPIMNSIIKDFMKKHKLNFNILNETANNKLLKGTNSSDKLTCIVFTTPLPKMSEEELPQFDLVIAYDTSFNPKKHLLHTKTNENIPTIRLVTKNTLEHAINYLMLQHQEDNFSFSNLSLFEMKRILTFGLLKKNQFVEAGCELSRFDIQGTCDKVFQWINEGMSRNLSFGMETTVEKIWGKIISSEHVSFDRRLVGTGNNNKDRKDLKDVASAKAEKRVSEVNDEGNLKKRKDKEVAQNDDDSFQKKKKLKIIDEALPTEILNSCGSSSSASNENKVLSLTTTTSTILPRPIIISPTEPLTESPIEQMNPVNLNKVKQTHSPKNSRDDSSKDSRRNSLKDSSRDSHNKSRDSTQDTIKDSSSSSIKSSSINRENNNRNIITKDFNKNVKSTSKDSNKSSKDSQCMEESTLEWRQKYMELLNQNKLQEEKIENLTQEKDKFCKKTNELSSELAKTRTQLGEMQLKRKRTLLEVQSIELEKTRMEISGVQVENSKLKSELENKDQEINKLKKEIDSLKNNSKVLKSKIKSLETEILNNQQMRLGSSSKTIKRNETLENQVQQLESKINTLQQQYKLKEEELKWALGEEEYHRDITNLLLHIKGKTKEEMDKIYHAKKNGTQSKSDASDNTHPNIDEKILNEVNTVPDNKDVPVIEKNTNESSLSMSNTKNVSNEDKSTFSFGYFDAELNELPGPPIGSVISTSSTFNCNWDSCKQEFGSREDLKLHLRYDHNLNPNYPSNVIEIND
ncbi:hypothetical protein RclHR1_02970006 [Rhizophagus clarus]|uniref:Chromo domain-containing protein n=1 Tax=Rhizophagus clarus TaxID=94130 RepID=A0A2Z6RKV5_9GLOM|nr:hypothetical protein RclHR1_02970006 [Rhizophagus clarus]